MRAIRAVLGEDGYEVEFADNVIGNRSPVGLRLMDSIRALRRRARTRAPA